MSEYLTVPEAATYLRISARKVYDLVSRSGLPHRRAGARLLFERIALAEWVRSSGRGVGMPALPLVLAGSHDALMDWAVRASRSTMATLCRGSRDGLERVLRREACAALLHLPGPDADAGSPGTGPLQAGRFNVDAVSGRFEGQDVALLNWCWRQQGLIVAHGNPRRIGSIADLWPTATRRRLKVGRRSAGAGSRELFDRLIANHPDAAGAGGARKTKVRGAAPSLPITLALDDLQSENDAAMAVRHGHVDAVFGAQSAAQPFGLDFVPVLQERVDLLINRRSYFEPPLQALLAFCRTRVFADYAEELGGYDLSAHGAVIWNAT